MEGEGKPRFNEVISDIIEKSLFTERQIEIILNKRGIRKGSFRISRGAYYRQVAQSREKTVSFLYSLVLLRGLGVLEDGDIDVMDKLSGQIRVINEGDIFPEHVDDVMRRLDEFVRDACRM
ncbi:MAG: hypothetical protein MPJ06_00775 [Nitrosopumilus sp.]|nr:hypothetical protein [Nitrosopumilus sp.]MDA7942531.1 hypothetical protein [Nitrosopumilus sp.]